MKNPPLADVLATLNRITFLTSSILNRAKNRLADVPPAVEKDVATELAEIAERLFDVFKSLKNG